MKYLSKVQNETDLTTVKYVQDYVETEGGKIDVIAVDDIDQPIVAKRVNIVGKADKTYVDEQDNTKVDKESTGTLGVSKVTNDGTQSAIKFENTDKTHSFIGVNNTSIPAQIYAIDSDTNSGSRLDITKNKIYYSVGSDEATVRDIDSNEIAVIKNVTDLKDSFDLVKQEQAEEGYFASYKLMIGTNQVGSTINIPKDFLVKEAKLETVTETDVPYPGAVIGEKYIDFIINVKAGATATSEHIYLPVNDLVEVYSGDSSITISNKNVISVSDTYTTGVDNKINIEKTRATSAEDTITSNLNSEISRATSAESTLTTNLNTEVTRATTQEETLLNKFNDYSTTTQMNSAITTAVTPVVATITENSGTYTSDKTYAELLTAYNSNKKLKAKISNIYYDLESYHQDDNSFLFTGVVGNTYVIISNDGTSDSVDVGSIDAIPYVVLTSDMIIGTDPITIQLTDEQFEIALTNQFISLDVSEIGLGQSGIMKYNESNSEITFSSSYNFETDDTIACVGLTINKSNKQAIMTMAEVTDRFPGSADSGTAIVKNSSGWNPQDGYGYIDKTELVDEVVLSGWSPITASLNYVSGKTPSMKTISDDYIYEIYWGGTKYTCRPIENVGSDSITVLGNLHLYDEDCVNTGEPFIYVVSYSGMEDIWASAATTDINLSVTKLDITKIDSKYLEVVPTITLSSSQEVVGADVPTYTLTVPQLTVLNNNSIVTVDGLEPPNAKLNGQPINQKYTVTKICRSNFNPSDPDMQFAWTGGNGTSIWSYLFKISGTKFEVYYTDIDPREKMDISNPSGTGSLSINRKDSTTVGQCSSTLGYNNESSGQYSFASGYATKASGSGAFSEGNSTIASGEYSHAEGTTSQSIGNYSHSEGYGTKSSSSGAHAEGWNTTASGQASHTEGWFTTASGQASHAEGWYTKSSSDYQHVEGCYNIEDTSSKYLHIVGNGEGDTERSNAETLDVNGNLWVATDIMSGGTSMDSPEHKLSEKQDAILVDRTTSKKYKLFIDNGIIGIEEVE